MFALGQGGGALFVLPRPGFDGIIMLSCFVSMTESLLLCRNPIKLSLSDPTAIYATPPCLTTDMVVFSVVPSCA